MKSFEFGKFSISLLKQGPFVPKPSTLHYGCPTRVYFCCWCWVPPKASG